MITQNKTDWAMWAWVVIGVGLVAVVAFVAFAAARIAPVAV